MTTMTEPTTLVTAGADTHRDQHVVAALDERGGELGVRSFATTTAGYRQALAWLRSLGPVERRRGYSQWSLRRRHGKSEGHRRRSRCAVS